MGKLTKLRERHNMLKLVGLVVCVAALSHGAPEPRINCQECMDEMHTLGYIVKMGSSEMEEYLKANYCPTLEEHQDMCVQMIVNHYFVDGAIHICMAWGVCQPKDVAALMNNKQPRPFTCPECVEGMEWVGAYMNDPLWIAEYVVYLEQNFCVGHNDHHCIDMVQRHFPPMHQMTMEKFFVPQEICDIYYPACGGTKPPM